MSEQLRKGFDGDENFFNETIGMTDTGKLEKSIPTVENKEAKVAVTKKSIPKAVVDFKKKIEDAFKTIDTACDDLQALCKDSNNWRKKDLYKMLGEYNEFKSLFSGLINDTVNYPQYFKKNDGMQKVSESEWDKSHIKI